MANKLKVRKNKTNVIEADLKCIELNFLSSMLKNLRFYLLVLVLYFILGISLKHFNTNNIIYGIFIFLISLDLTMIFYMWRSNHVFKYTLLNAEIIRKREINRALILVIDIISFILLVVAVKFPVRAGVITMTATLAALLLFVMLALRANILLNIRLERKFTKEETAFELRRLAKSHN